MPVPAEIPGMIKPVARLDESLYKLDAEESAFFKQLTGIHDDDELKSHIIRIQYDAYQVFPYLCIQAFSFIHMQISHLPAYPQLLEIGRTRSNPILLDLGCSFGGDLRKAVSDGFPAKGCIGCDLHPEFWDLGHKLFRSTPSTFPATFVAGNTLDVTVLDSRAEIQSKSNTAAKTFDVTSLSNGGSLKPLEGHADVVHGSHFFHLFTEEQQTHLARAAAALLKTEPGSMIFGVHGGLEKKGMFSLAPGMELFAHSPQSWIKLWQGIFGKDEIKAEARLTHITIPSQVPQYDGPKCYMLQWSVVRL